MTYCSLTNGEDYATQHQLICMSAILLRYFFLIPGLYLSGAATHCMGFTRPYLLLLWTGSYILRSAACHRTYFYELSLYPLSCLLLDEGTKALCAKIRDMCESTKKCLTQKENKRGITCWLIHMHDKILYFDCFSIVLCLIENITAISSNIYKFVAIVIKKFLSCAIRKAPSKPNQSCMQASTSHAPSAFKTDEHCE